MDVLKGKHCAFEECKQFDFLPFWCESCQKTYCSNHRTQKDHKCPKLDDENTNIVPKCPICNQMILVNKNDNVDDIISKHIDGGCKDYVLHENKKPACAYSKCKSMKAPIECKECHKFFCPQHRFPSDHQCEKSNENNNDSSDIISKGKEYLTSLGVLSDNKNDSSKLEKERLRMKNVAIGNNNIETKDRFYVHVLFSDTINKKEITMFFNKNKTVGRILDEICDERRIKNENHKPDSNKLVIQCIRTNGILPFDMPLYLMDPEFMSGDTISIKYESE